MKTLQETVRLWNGVQMPVLGLGTYKLTDSSMMKTAIATAVENGYRLIDTATLYANQTVIGEYLASHKTQRAELFITSKIWNADHDYAKAKQAINQILKELQLEYIDLLLVHWPTAQALECWKALEEAYEAGQVRAIGVSNFTADQLTDFINRVRIKPMVNQIEMHLGLNRSAEIAFCQAHDIAVTSWRTLGGHRGFEIPLLTELATKYQTQPANICLKWALQQGVCVIPKSSHPERIISNAQLDGFTLNDSEMYALLTLPQQDLYWPFTDFDAFSIAWNR